MADQLNGLAGNPFGQLSLDQGGFGQYAGPLMPVKTMDEIYREVDEQNARMARAQAIAAAQARAVPPVQALEEKGSYFAGGKGPWYFTREKKPDGTSRIVLNASEGGQLADNTSARSPLLALAMIQSLAPHHTVTPVDYDPWKFVPKLGSVG